MKNTPEMHPNGAPVKMKPEMHPIGAPGKEMKNGDEECQDEPRWRPGGCKRQPGQLKKTKGRKEETCFAYLYTLFYKITYLL